MNYSRQHVPLDNYYRQAVKEAEAKILRADASKIIDSKADALAEEFSKSFLLRKVEIYPEKLEKKFIRRVQTIPSHQRESFYRGEGDLDFEFEYIQVKIPVNSSADLNEYRSFLLSSYSMSWSPDELEITGDCVAFEIMVKGYCFTTDEDRLKQTFESEKNHVIQWVNSLNSDIENLNASHKRALITFIESRQAALKEGDVRASSLLDSL